MFKQFKEFISKGNVMDLAVGVVIGGAFQSIINSLVSDIIMPVVSMITGKVDFSDMKFSKTMFEGTPLESSVSITYGNFITQVVNFLIIAFTIFLVVTYINKLNKKMEEVSLGQVKKITKKFKKNGKEEEKVEEVIVEPENKICPFCLTEIKYKATRCPHCTSKLEGFENKLEEAK